MLGAGPTFVFDADGSAIVIHAQADDQRTDPSGNSGARILCGPLVARPGISPAIGLDLGPPSDEDDAQRRALEDAERVLDDLQILKEIPWPGPPKVKRLRGHGLFRLHMGDYRSVFEERKGTVVVLRIVDRKEFDRALKAL
jgi:mRNA-degrading endonuclease RelE of RelBE toxin-antitoxin system